MNKLLADLEEDTRDKLKARGSPSWVVPMLATLSDERFSSPEWIYERKLDGERCLVFRDRQGARLRSRNRKLLGDTYPELVEATAKACRWRYVADGEVVAFDGAVTSFARLQARMQVKSPERARRSPVKVYLYLFDLLYLDGYDLTALTLRTRKYLLRRALSFEGRLRFTPHRNEDGEKYYRRACAKGWEGLIAKQADSRYLHGRSRQWLKFKCGHQQELVVGGYTEPSSSREGLGALLVGFYKGKRLHYAGKVGTGFDTNTLHSLAKRLATLEQDRCPFVERKQAAGKGVRWVHPELVAEIGFTEWTEDDRLRHPRFLGLRRDKLARNVVKEQR